jgi:hypothetical protein
LGFRAGRPRLRGTCDGRGLLAQFPARPGRPRRSIPVGGQASPRGPRLPQLPGTCWVFGRGGDNSRGLVRVGSSRPVSRSAGPAPALDTRWGAGITPRSKIAATSWYLLGFRAGRRRLPGTCDGRGLPAPLPARPGPAPALDTRWGEHYPDVQGRRNFLGRVGFSGWEATTSGDLLASR